MTGPEAPDEWQIFPIMMGWGRSYALDSGLLSTQPHPSLAESEFAQAAALAGRRPQCSSLGRLRLSERSRDSDAAAADSGAD
jgi:hypothetical protein